MKLTVGLAAVALLSIAVLRAEERFSQTMSPADFTAAGLDRLKPEQLARLDELARAFQARALQKTPTAAAQQKVAQMQAEQGNSTQAQAGGLGAGHGSKSAKPAAPAPETSRIVGTVSGWDAHTVFTLENGEVWTVSNYDRYNGPPMKNPAVQIRPATSFGGFWMKIESLPEVRVRLLSSAGALPEK
jgi:hypothetical protein